jgi:hypothetical protein
MATRKVTRDEVEKQALPVPKSICDLIGASIGALNIIAYLGFESRRHGRHHFYGAKCDCGQFCILDYNRLLKGEPRSCGCENSRSTIGKRATTHGMTYTPTYSVWNAMKTRCLYKCSGSYERYGGAGVKVCDEWMKSFEAFLSHVGPRPSMQHTLDRIDAKKNYEPGNVRWATVYEQCRHKSSNRILVVDGVGRSMVEWSEIGGISYDTLKNRIYDGWEHKAAVFTPVRKMRKWNGKRPTTIPLSG